MKIGCRGGWRRATAGWTQGALECFFGEGRRCGYDAMPTLSQSLQPTSALICTNCAGEGSDDTTHDNAAERCRCVVAMIGRHRSGEIVASDAAQLAVAPERAHRGQFVASSAVVRAR